MSIPFFLPVGHVLKYGDRRVRFDEELGRGILGFRYIDGEEETVLVPNPATGDFNLPTTRWVIDQFRAGIIIDPGFSASVDGRSAGNLHLDRAACLTIDPSCGWRYDWADAAIQAAITKTEVSAKYWIYRASGPGKKPQPRSLLRWMKKLQDHGGRIGALVSTAGREKGQSQLSDIEDRLVHKWAMRYWHPDSLNGRLAHKECAAAMVVAEWDILVEMGLPFLGTEAPSAETVRKRINGLECYSTLGPHTKYAIGYNQRLRGTGPDAKDVTKKLQAFLDRGVVPIVFMGDETSQSFFEVNPQFAARLLKPLELRPLQLAKMADRKLFMDFCVEFDRQLVAAGATAMSSVLADHDVLEALIEVSGGHVGRVARLIQVALPAALERGAITIERYDLSNAVRDFAIDIGWIDYDPFLLPQSPRVA